MPADRDTLGAYRRAPLVRYILGRTPISMPEAFARRLAEAIAVTVDQHIALEIDWSLTGRHPVAGLRMPRRKA